jgi:hypothetical protein
MGKIVFYRQARADGGMHTGVSVNEVTIVDSLEGSGPLRDPVLLWYVDVRAEGPALPENPYAVRDWLVNNGPAIAKGLEREAERAAAGIDVDSWPASAAVEGFLRDTRVRIVYSAGRRARALEIASVLKDIAKGWHEIVGNLFVPASVGGRT